MSTCAILRKPLPTCIFYFLIREEENKRKSYDNAFRYAASVNENFNIDLGSIPLKAFDEIKFMMSRSHKKW